MGQATGDVIVHEWVHALQDQHFDLVAYDVLDTTDAFLARRAVVEGDTVLAQLRFPRQQDGSDLHAVSWRATCDAWRAFSDEQLATTGYPPIFLDYVSFVYAYGLVYAARNLLGDAVDGDAIAAPPRDRASGAMAVTWASAWTSEAAAADVASALWLLHGGARDADGLAFAGTAADGEALWIEQRADRVVFIKNLTATDAAALAEEAFGTAPAPALRRHPSLAQTMARARRATSCHGPARGALLDARGL